MQAERPALNRLSWIMLLACVSLLFSLALAWRQESLHAAPFSLTPSLTGKPEYCLTCHSDLPEISSSHPVKTFGCIICHGGERLALNAELAHSNMRGGKNPSDLAVVEQSCGGENCHSGASSDWRDHIQRVITSIQSTYAGAITSIRYTFGAQPDLAPHFGAINVQDDSLPSATGITFLDAFQPSTETNPLLQVFGQNCLVCHLNAPPREDIQYNRFTGCSACHSLTRTHPASGAAQGKDAIHQLTTAIPYTQCNTCHNRGNYDLRQMTFMERADQPITRIQDYYQPIAQFTRCEYTLDCVDCHTRTEAMGDGDIHAAQADIQYVQCKTCHGTLNELPLVKTLNDPGDLAFRLAVLNPVIDLKLGDVILITEQGEPLWNARLLPDGSYELFGKVTRQHFYFRPVLGSACLQNPTQQASQSCHECHAVER